MLLMLALLALAAVLLPLVLPIISPLYFSDWNRPIQGAEWRLQDGIQVRATPGLMRGDIVVLGVDDASFELKSAWPEDIEGSKTLQAIKRGWPFSRQVYADAVTRVLDAGARAVMLDFVFSGPLQADPEGDAALREVLKKRPQQVILASSFGQTENINGMTPVLQMPWDGLLPMAVNDALPPNIGFVNYWPNADQVTRSIRFNRSMRYEDANRPDLAHLDQMPSVVSAMMRLTGGGAFVPNDDHWHSVRFSVAGAYPAYSLHEIFVPDLWENNFGKGSFFKDKIVLIGPAAPHSQDFHTTPVGRMYGVQVHAQVMAAALNGQFLSHPPRVVYFVSVVLAALIAWMLVVLWKKTIAITLALIVFSGLGLVFCFALFEYKNIVADGVAPLLSFNLAGLLCLSYDFMLERRQRRQLASFLERYHSPDVVRLLMRNPEHLRSLQNGADRVVTVLFSDLRGFTSLSEKMTPKELVTQLNQYFNSMVAVVHNHDGGIDKFIGDAIMAVWGWVAPNPNAQTVQQNALDAVQATLRMRDALEELNRDWAERGSGELKIGVGVHQGDAVVGDLGSKKQSGFTVIGDSVNTGSRLEGTTKEYGVDNIISDVIWNQVKDKYVCRSADLTRVKGKLIPVPLYTVVHEIEKGVPPGMEAFEQGVTLYRKGEFEEAQAAFRHASAEGLDDHLTRLYLDRCHALIEHPPATWDGVFVMTKK